MTSEPTPGEFRLSADGLSVYANQPNGGVRFAARLTAAYREGPNAAPIEELRVNARLFHASKDMLEALRSFVTPFDEFSDDELRRRYREGIPDGVYLCPDRIIAARAAIKLATELTV